MRKSADRERLRRLCVQAVCALEDLRPQLMRGQAVNTSARRYRMIVRILGAAAGDLTRVTYAMEKILGNSGASGKARTRRRRP